jgi:hypothetical protein
MSMDLRAGNKVECTIKGMLLSLVADDETPFQ